jgi:hypothetical protein
MIRPSCAYDVTIWPCLGNPSRRVPSSSDHRGPSWRGTSSSRSWSSSWS